MNKKIFLLFSLPILLLVTTSLLHAQQQGKEAKITVELNKPGHKVSPTLFGIFFEDINNSTDGGVYPELVRNRSFEDANSMQYWKFESTDGKSSALIFDADAQTRSRQPALPLNPFNLKSLLLKVNGSFKLENDGYWGMNIVQGNSYKFKLAARTPDSFNSPLNIRVMSSDGKILASGEIKNFKGEWQYHLLDLTASGSDTKAHLEISGEGIGTLYLDMVSLLPDKTWKNHGLRIDLSEALDALHPRFMRFPGGSWVDGSDIAHMYYWKNTIGSIDTRKEAWNLWNYYATNSIGYYEYLQLSEDLGAEPLFCINVGMSSRDVIPMDKMGQWEQDALDAIEYANGSVNSVWGSLRAKYGHPKPFNLKYVEIGNENGGNDYYERWALMAKAIHAKYPHIKLIADDWSGGHPQNPKPDIVDEHYYNNPDWFIWNSNKYDSYDRKGPKIFIGEYAVTSNSGEGNLRGAIGEAAWMTGMERNSDIVEMGSYAPLFSNVNNKSWPINLINFDNHRWYGLPSYYVQQMFAENQGTETVPVKIENAPTIKAPYSSGFIGLGTWNNSAEFKDLKVISPEGKIIYQSDFSKNIDDWRKIGMGEWSVHDGVLKQSAKVPNVTAFVGDSSWTDYTITLKARKISGENGFQIYFRDGNISERNRWDLGGFTNSVYLLDTGIMSKSKKGGIVPGCWYDIKIVIRGKTVKGYLDGKFIEEVADNSADVESLCTSAERDNKSGDIILKVVNAAFKPIETQIDLNGAGKLSATGKAIVLTSGNAADENTLDDPTKVSPKTETIKFSGTTIFRSFPGNSLTVIRIPTSGK